MTDQQKSEERLHQVEQQIKACEKGRQDHIHCPYCGARNYRGDMLCCMTLAKACRAVIERQTMEELAETAERIAESVDKNPSMIIQ